MRDSHEKGAGMGDQDPPFQTLNEELHPVQDKSKTKKARNQDLQIQTRPLKAQRKHGNASFVFRPNDIQSPPTVQRIWSAM